MVSVLGVESQAVSLAACHLLQVMFDALKDGARKGFRGKEGAIVVGEWRRGWAAWVCHGGGGAGRRAFWENGLVTAFYSRFFFF